MDKRLLILGCADRKRDSGGLLPALDRYDGPAYRVIRTFLREYQWPEGCLHSCTFCRVWVVRRPEGDQAV